MGASVEMINMAACKYLFENLVIWGCIALLVLILLLVVHKFIK